jgi:hypothetical protein
MSRGIGHSKWRSTRARLVPRASAVFGILVIACVSLACASEGFAATLTVCTTGCAFSQVAPALAAANSGDTLKLGAGTYEGGFTIVKSVSLVGSGAHATIIRGGGPVITIGSLQSASPKLTVAISGVTITGGHAHSSLETLVDYGNKIGVTALGGGIAITPGNVVLMQPQTPGATVTISSSVITGNTVSPGASVPLSNPCRRGPCPFNDARGGGIYNSGALTLRNSTVTDNRAIGIYATGGGIFSDGLQTPGSSLTMTADTVSDNDAIAPAAMVGQDAEGGGISVAQGGALTVIHSRVSDNRATLTSSLPVSAGGQAIDLGASSAGIEVGDSAPTEIENTTISGNSVSATDPSGTINATNAAMQIGDGHLLMANTVISHNRVTSDVATDGVAVPPAHSIDSGGDGGAIEVDGDGTITDSKIIDNAAATMSKSGPVAENGGLFRGTPSAGPAGLLTLKSTVISGNMVSASSPHASATVQGAGIVNLGKLALDHVQVRDNSATATGRHGVAQGAGIWNGSVGTGPHPRLTLDDTVVTNNALSGSPGVTVAGAGLFTEFSVTLTASTFSANTPDECSGARC